VWDGIRLVFPDGSKDIDDESIASLNFLFLDEAPLPRYVREFARSISAGIIGREDYIQWRGTVCFEYVRAHVKTGIV
jgi:hypothetical protein